jgi:anti-sigma-K factor RskA
MSCEELQDMYELYALGVLDPEERAEIDAHLARDCKDCKRSLADAIALNAVLLSIGPEEAPSKQLRHRLLASIGYERPGWFWAGALAAVLMLTLAVWLGTQERERSNQLANARKELLQVTGERDRLNQAVQFLSDPETKPASFGRGQQAPPRGYVFLHPQLGVMLIASNLPAAGAGKIYEMWVLPKVGAPRPAGLFQSDGMRGLHILSGPVDMDALKAVAVTVEPTAGSPGPTSTPIIVAAAGS